MTRSWKLHTPDGTNDFLQRETALKRQIQKNILNIFSRAAYFQVETPSYEYFDVYSAASAFARHEEVVRFVDSKGRLLALRPDITTPIARMAVTKYKEELLPWRFSYMGQVYRNSLSNRSAHYSEFTQAGIELIGSDWPDSDAEIIATTIKTLIAADIEDFQIELGQVDFFKGITQDFNLDAEQIETLRELVDSKNTLAIEEHLSDIAIPIRIKELLLRLPAMFGDADILTEAQSYDAGEVSVRALDNLREIYTILTDYGYEQYLSIDLGMVHSIDYYTGMIFKGFIHGSGSPVCGGGRYDGLTSAFGRTLPATGSAINVDDLLAVKARKLVICPEVSPDFLVAASRASRKAGVLVVEALRRNGASAQLHMDDSDPVKCAEAKGIPALVLVNGPEHIVIKDLIKDSSRTVSIDQLTSSWGRGVKA